MEEHLNKLMSKLINFKNEKKEMYSGVWLSMHESNPLLISFDELNKLTRIQSNQIQNQEENFMSIQRFIDYIYKRKLAEDKGVEKIVKKLEDINQVLDDFEHTLLNSFKKFQESILKEISPDKPSLQFCNKFLKAYCDGNFKSDEEVIINTKELVKNLIGMSVIDIDKFNDDIDKGIDINQKVDQIKKTLEQVQNCFASLNLEPKPIIKLKGVENQYEKPLVNFDNSFVLKWNEHEMVYQWIKDQVGASKTFEILFNSMYNGYTNQAFHSRCDNKGPTVIFIETTTGKRFGGYANSSWHSNNAGITDEKCFIFSLDLKEKYLHKPGSLGSMEGYTNYGPSFGSGNWDLYLNDNCNINNSRCNPNCTYNFGPRTSNEVAGSTTFIVRNYEAYLVKQVQI